MKLRLCIGALALAVATPLLGAVPANAKTDPIDPDARTALKAAFTATEAAFGVSGGTVRLTVDGATAGGAGGYATVNEVDATGTARTRTTGADLLQLPGYEVVYQNRAGRVVAAKVTATVRKALRKHGLRPSPRWYVPGRKDLPLVTSAIRFSAVFDALDEQLVALSSTTAGDTTTYTATTRANSTDGTYLIVVVGGVLHSVTGEGMTMTVTVGHAPIAVPKADRKHRKLIATENQQVLQVWLLNLSLPKRASVAKRVAVVRAQARQLAKAYPRTTARDVRRGAEVTVLIKSWKQPLTWRYLVTKKGIVARPVRTA